MGIICPSCGAENLLDAEFCSECGKPLSGISIVEKNGKVSSQANNSKSRFYKTRGSLAKALPVWFFLLFIDWVTGEKGINWAYWVIIPWLVFGPLASFMMELLVIQEDEESLAQH